MKKDWDEIEKEEIKKCKGTTFREASDADHYLSKVWERQEEELMDKINNTLTKLIEEKKAKENKNKI